MVFASIMDRMFLAEMDSIEDDDQYMNESFIDEDSGELDDGGDSDEENAEEVIDYEEMKRDLELFQNVWRWIVVVLTCFVNREY